MPKKEVLSDGSLTQAELAERLGLDTSNVGRARKRMGEEEFREWSKERDKKDPESAGWRYCEKKQRYFKVER